VVLLVAAQTNTGRSLWRAHNVLSLTIRKLRETNGALRLEIKEHTHAEDELRLAYQRLTYLVENTPLAVIEFDKDLTIQRWSRRAEEIFGWKASEALTKNVYDADFRIIYDEDKKAVDKINQELMQGAVNRNLSLNRNFTKSGEIIDCEWHNSVLRDEHGDVIAILSLVQDVTEKRKAEETLNHSYEQIRQLSNHLQNIREEERAHIAREIHDELGQQLTVLKMDILGLNKRLNGADAATHEKIGEIVDLLDTTVKSVRRISSELRPSLLYNLGLVAAIEWQVKEFEKRSGIRTVFIEPVEELHISDPVKNGLFRIFQESLTNAGRHANASKIIVSLERMNGQLILTVEDNGQGFEMEKIGTKQTLGILGMKERCQMMGGNFEIKSSPGNGTAVVVAVPYHGID
jgi:PAS domain S-box-containing protein